MINDMLRLVFVLNFISATSVSRNQQQQSDVHKYSIQMIGYSPSQVHYAQPFIGNVRDYSGVTLHMSIMRPVYQAAVMLFVSGQSIPPHRKQVQNNISCEYTSDTEIHPFAFRTHTHAMGRVVSAYFKRKDQWTKIGSRNPQWPQLFEIISTSPVIRKGDLMAASCRFDSYDKSEAVPMGLTLKNILKEEMISYPAEGFELLPYHPELEHHAHQSMVRLNFYLIFRCKSL
uniref:Cu2_monoox_C domain-containing protein n=1 Tax=Heterorhabditis bacteriophora TaxID=37862 RepID=A0A1I7WFW3_HETBA